MSVAEWSKHLLWFLLCLIFTPVSRATLVNELVERGEKMLRDGLKTPSSNPSKLKESICSQLCVAGLEALDRASR